MAIQRRVVARVNATPRRLSRGKGGTGRGRLGVGDLDRAGARAGCRCRALAHLFRGTGINQDDHSSVGGTNLKIDEEFTMCTAIRPTTTPGGLALPATSARSGPPAL